MINNVSMQMGILGMSTRTTANFSSAVTNRVEKVLPDAVKNLSDRIDVKGQFLKWAKLPENQINRVDAIYDMVRALKSQTDAKMLTVLGIGGSKHTIEHMLGINGLNIKGDKVKFFSDIDSTSFNRFMYQIDNDVQNSNYLVVSKSGSTFETKDGMTRILDRLKAKFNPTVVFPRYADKEAGKYMVAVTDANSENSQLRRLAYEQGWIGDLYIHDDVGGRFSALDDHVLFTLAYAGMKKEDMIKMLQSADSVSDIVLNNNGCMNYIQENNQPIMQAAFWVAAKLDGIKNGVHQYLGDVFNSTEKWHAQMQNESVKNTSKQIAKITDAMHHSSEAWYKLGNKYAFALTAPNDSGEAKENVLGYISAIEKTNSEYGPSMVELLDTRGLGLTPEAAGAMTQSRAFSTVYQEIIEKLALGEPLPDVLSSVLQPNVEAYKRNLKPAGGNNPPVVAGRISINV